ncbi:hypothetical protein P9B01_02735 [Bacillus subtilis]|uniref:hypothetical protein n=1 Tax=Bacillus subtilis TaxID=1423 RepID=UPI002DB991E4|nr:hypothetical protein [Bacillus subtilis]MEC1007993.1 hypothetical protein [Bacillus subtilis]MEC1072785.1 hypothetical protein [Bacillus subtilis]
MTETKKYVRIKKATVDGVWYADKIGQIFEVVRENSVAILTKCGGHHSVLREDAEVIVTEKRIAAVGERVLITKSYPLGKQTYKAGDVFEVAIANNPAPGCIKVSGVSSFIDYKEYEVIVNNEVKNEEDDEMKNVNQTVINRANTVFEKKNDKYFGYKSRFGDIVIGGAYSYRFVVHYAKTNKDVVIIPGDVNKVTTPVCTTVEERLWKPGAQAKARRDEIVEQAKADIEVLKTPGRMVNGNTSDYKVDLFGANAEFVVNREKRTVVALLKGAYSGTVVLARGIAKAAPSDCFNVHIGKAIALRRALGLAVPDEYLNAPQPTEVRVGDFISDVSGVNKALVIEDDSWPPFSGGSVIYLKDARKYGCRTIDDSREEVGE